MEPGKMPPISAWWPLDAVKKMISFELGANTGVMMVISGRWLDGCKCLILSNPSNRNFQSTYDPPACGELVMSTSPSLSELP